MAQPALSVQIRQLEEQIGAALFERHARGVKLTPTGDRLLVHAVEILKRVDVAYEDIRSAFEDPGGRVSIALPQSVAKFITVPLVQEVLIKWPKIRLQLVEMSTGYIPDQLLRGLIDIGITFGAEDDIRIQFKHLLDEELVLAVSLQQLPGLHIASKRTNPVIDLHAIGALPMILPTPAHSLRRRIDDYLRQEKLSLNVVAEVNAVPELMALTRAGVGSTILSFAAVNDYVKKGQLVSLRIRNPEMTRAVYSCRSGTLPMSNAAAKVHDVLHRIIGELNASGAWPSSMQSAVIAPIT